MAKKMTLWLQRDYAVYHDMYVGMTYNHRNGKKYKILECTYISGVFDQEWECLVKEVK